MMNYAQKRERDAKILKRFISNEFKNELRRKRTRQGAFERSFLHLGHPIAYGLPVIDPSDEGKGAGEIRSACQDTPKWRKLWDKARKKLTKKQRRILDALLVDYRTGKAAEMAGVSRPTIDTFKKNFFKKHFAQCFQGYKRDFG